MLSTPGQVRVRTCIVVQFAHGHERMVACGLHERTKHILAVYMAQDDAMLTSPGNRLVYFRSKNNTVPTFLVCSCSMWWCVYKQMQNSFKVPKFLHTSRLFTRMDSRLVHLYVLVHNNLFFLLPQRNQVVHTCKQQQQRVFHQAINQSITLRATSCADGVSESLVSDVDTLPDGAYIPPVVP